MCPIQVVLLSPLGELVSIISSLLCRLYWTGSADPCTCCSAAVTHFVDILSIKLSWWFKTSYVPELRSPSFIMNMSGCSPNDCSPLTTIQFVSEEQLYRNFAWWQPVHFPFHILCIRTQNIQRMHICISFMCTVMATDTDKIWYLFFSYESFCFFSHQIVTLM